MPKRDRPLPAFLRCEGCRIMAPGQTAHMGLGGCLAEPDSEDEDDNQATQPDSDSDNDQPPPAPPLRRAHSASAAGRLTTANQRLERTNATADFCPRRVRPVQVGVPPQRIEPDAPPVTATTARGSGRGRGGGGRGRGRGRARAAVVVAINDEVDTMRARRLGGGGGKTPKQIDDADPFVRRILSAGDVCTENQDENWMANDPACLRVHCDDQNKVINRLATLMATHGSNQTWSDAPPATTKGSIVTARQYERGFKGILACNSADFKNLDELYAFYCAFPEPPGKISKRIAFTDYIAKHYYPNLGDVLLNQHGQRHKHFSNWVSGMGWLGRFIGRE